MMPASPPPTKAKSTKDAIGRWSLFLIVALAGGALGWAWLVWGASQRQNQVLVSAFILAMTVLALLIWLLFLSPWPWKKRLLVAVGVAVPLVIVGSSLELRDLSGDLVPIFAWRWSRGPAEPASPPASIESADRATWQLSSTRDYPQYLGPNRTGEVRGAHLARDASIADAELLWRQPIGAGWSGFAVAGDFAVTQEQRGIHELIVAYELVSGKTRWAHAIEARHEDPLGGPGPRATPTLASGRVYAQGATGILSCLDLASGRLIWRRDILAEHEAERLAYGVSSSPLVVDDKVVVLAGGTNGSSLVAYERQTGELVWAGGSDPAAYSSPTLMTLAGHRQIVVFNQAHLSSHDVRSGQVLWRHPWPRGSEHTSQPVLLPGDRIFLSSGYGVGSQLLQISRDTADRWQVSRVWQSLGIKAKLTNVVHHEGYLYGLDDGILACLKATTGERCWKRGRYGHGQLILADDLLVVLSEKGFVAVVEARPTEARELGRFPAIEGKTWNTPALAGNLLLVRNAEEAACYRLPRQH